MDGKIVFAGLILALSATGASAQNKGQTTTQDDIYCSGMVTTESVPRDTYVITGEESSVENAFMEGDYLYINKGANQGVKVGDQFSVVREIKDPIDIEWTKWQFSILKKMGTVWEDSRPAEGGGSPAGCVHRASRTLLRLPPARRYRAAVYGAPFAAAEIRGQLRSVRAAERETDGDGDYGEILGPAERDEQHHLREPWRTRASG